MTIPKIILPSLLAVGLILMAISRTQVCIHTAS